VEFRNLTPFDALMFPAHLQGSRPSQVLVMKVGYRLQPIGAGRMRPVVMDEAPLALCMADEYRGEPGVSSVHEESDLAPFKPLCDVIVRGHAYAPAGRPASSWDARLRVSMPLPTAPLAEAGIRPASASVPSNALPPEQHECSKSGNASAAHGHSVAPSHVVLIDKAVRVHGPRRFLHRGVRSGGRLLQRQGGALQIGIGNAEETLVVPLAWENAWGGRSRVTNPAHALDETEPEFLLDEVCFSNPLGCGWYDARHAALHAGGASSSLYESRPAPQIEYPDSSPRGPLLAQHPEPPLDAAAMAVVAASYGMTPAGFGFMGRAWAPRLALAGTFDDNWRERRWPRQPVDADAEFWNGAPADQRVDGELPGNAHIELWNLVPPQHADAGGRAFVDLPGHRPFLLLRLSCGTPLPMRPVADTVVIDTDAMTLSLTYRLCIPASAVASVRVAEARFELDPAGALVKLPVSPASYGGA
jgi:hypothetical protein